ncbi:hypothetical protein [Acinetobacter pittii]|uniref:hypothetical protein n=1 Tax=Acinetobacter pittii TaxID=48296 RepID=UPI0002CFFDF5|nr:hypothetical protein [Acinetobacter pittii]ENW10146.1 hypothetical protein F928_02991 [Acinetobacter pittii ATCC 19004 = CIP 70.29]MCG9522404.1 hypothetical protein [Acinetobacter pittii]MCK0869349.1 hypothetical protein [Acinetobacter pittii]MCK0919492.1 hypothetical protein [Acinetobacter pittii]MDP7900016.1 hypothetical protein [Acinetobacter pittii]
MQDSIPPEQNSAPPKKPFYKAWVFWVVCLYLLIIFLYTLKFCLGEGENVLLPSNELGDFLAGAFAPLAFLFLILGYKQNSESIRLQNEELRASTEALKLQVDEMKKSVDQQKIMAQLQQAELEDRHHSVAPVITVDWVVSVANGKFNFRISFTNKSEHPARYITVNISHHKLSTFEVFPKDHYQEILSPFTSDEEIAYRANKEIEREISIGFENILGRKYEQKYKLITFTDHGKKYVKTKRIL